MDYLKSIDTDLLDYRQEAVSAVSSRASRILKLFNDTLHDGVVDEIDMKRIASGIRHVIANKGAASTVLAELQAMRECKFAAYDRVMLACSVAGGVEYAKRRSNVGILSPDVEPVDCWAKIQKVEEIEDATGEPSIQMRLLICNSVLAGNVLMVEMQPKSARRWAWLMGISGSRRNRLPWYTIRQMTDAALTARVGRVSGDLQFVGAGVHRKMVSHNLKLAKSRSRLASECHFGATHECGECVVGRNQCERSCFYLDTHYELENL